MADKTEKEKAICHRFYRERQKKRGKVVSNSSTSKSNGKKVH